MGALNELREQLAEVSDLGRARALLAWDERTMMPRRGAGARAEQLATLSRTRHRLLASDELGRLIERADRECSSQASDSDDGALVRMARRDWEKARRVPAELRGELTRASSIAERAWEEARRRSDFGAFLPHLERNISLSRRYAECFEAEHPYEPLLDDFEPGARVAEVREVLSALREGLRPIVARAQARQEAVDDSCLHGSFELGAQRSLVGELIAGLPLGDGSWRLDEATHPFATAIGLGDIRLTTRYDESYIGSAVWSAIHEAGHGIYESGIPPDLARTPLFRPPSLSFHESQSRLWENWVGRGRPYLRHLHPRLQAAFPDAFGAVDPEGLYRAANRVEPKLIRVEADEVTYNLHIALRFELELALFEEGLSAAELPEAWRELTRSYLGLEVPDDAHGVLQDVHWAAGSFGYFPTYALGNVIAARLWELAAEALGELDAQLAAGETAPLRDWLADRLYRHAGKLLPAELLELVTGGGLDPAPLLRHLEAKVSDIYD